MIMITSRRLAKILILIAVGISDVSAEARQGPGLGKTIPPAEIAQWDISVFPEGAGLPEGEGTADEGEKIYQRHCLVCHGKNGLGASADQLAGAKMGLTSDYPEKTIGNYWPYSTTLFDMIRRSMPMTSPGVLNDDEVYAVTAYLLYLNGLIDKNDRINAKTLPRIKMPNAEGFINIYEKSE